VRRCSYCGCGVDRDEGEGKCELTSSFIVLVAKRAWDLVRAVAKGAEGAEVYLYSLLIAAAKDRVGE
jgi:hypothetical protein